MLEATLVILNANIITLNPEQPKAEAIAVYDEKIVAVGSNDEIRGYIGKETKVINAENKTVVPGFVDCHVHMTGFGQFLHTLDLRDAGSIKDVQQRLRDYTEKNPERSWVLGGSWDHEKFSEKRCPTRWDLDAAIAEKPVFIVRVCGHVGVVNSKALELAGIKKETTIEGGKVDLDEVTGEPNGILRENALELVWKAMPKPSLEEMEDTCVSACQRAVEAGLTGVHWLVNSAEEIRVLQRLCSEGRLPLRVYLGIPVGCLDELVALGLATGFGSDMLKVGFVKVFADGSFGGHTAALKEPYSDKPETSGMLIYTQRKLNGLVLKAHRAGLQVAVHAIGDRAIEAVLKAYEKALEVCPREDHRHRIEHCAVLNPKLIRWMKRLGLVVSVQPHFVVSDFWLVERLGGERMRWVYPFRTLVREGLVLVSGSDCPVDPINPLLGVWAAMLGRDFADESLTVEEVLRTYTANAAFASFDENRKGTVEVGKFADLTVFSGDLFRVSPDRIRDVKVEMTVVGGRVVYRREG